jgi:hypothetical protein
MNKYQNRNHLENQLDEIHNFLKEHAPLLSLTFNCFICNNPTHYKQAYRCENNTCNNICCINCIKPLHKNYQESVHKGHGTREWYDNISNYNIKKYCNHCSKKQGYRMVLNNHK